MCGGDFGYVFLSHTYIHTHTHTHTYSVSKIMMHHATAMRKFFRKILLESPLGSLGKNWGGGGVLGWGGIEKQNERKKRV